MVLPATPGGSPAAREWQVNVPLTRNNDLPYGSLGARRFRYAPLKPQPRLGIWPPDRKAARIAAIKDKNGPRRWCSSWPSRRFGQDEREEPVAETSAYSCVLMFGGPGSGKGTQGAVIGQMPNLVHLAMGDIFRGLDPNTDIGEEFLSYSTRGKLVPDELTIRVFHHHVEQRIQSCDIDPGYHTLILDGIPRTVAQAGLLREVVVVKRIVYLVMEDRDALIARLMGRARKSNRPDDADRSVIKNRIEVYERETAPVLEAYPKKLIARVNGDQPPLAVLRDIADCLVGYISGNI